MSEVRERYFGSDIEFCAWMRRQGKRMPSYSPTSGFVATDVDLHLHRYMHERDGMGTRHIQSLMMLEVKSRCGDVGQSQRDTLAKVHHCCFCRTPVNHNGQLVRHFGVSFLFLSGTTPDNSEVMQWGRFDQRYVVCRNHVSLEQLYQLMNFEIHPDNFTPQIFRRHHKTSETLEVVEAPLGFKYEKPLIKRS